MKKSILDKKFSHHIWYKGKSMTKREAMKEIASQDDFYLSKKPSNKQSDNLFDATIYDDVLTASRGSYRLTEEEKEYYLKCKNTYDEIKEKIKSNWNKGFDKWEYVEEYYKAILNQYNSISI